MFQLFTGKHKEHDGNENYQIYDASPSVKPISETRLNNVFQTLQHFVKRDWTDSNENLGTTKLYDDQKGLCRPPPPTTIKRLRYFIKNPGDYFKVAPLERMRRYVAPTSKSRPNPFRNAEFIPPYVKRKRAERKEKPRHPQKRMFEYLSSCTTTPRTSDIEIHMDKPWTAEDEKEFLLARKEFKRIYRNKDENMAKHWEGMIKHAERTWDIEKNKDEWEYHEKEAEREMERQMKEEEEIYAPWKRIVDKELTAKEKREVMERLKTSTEYDSESDSNS